ncbi:MULTISPECIES: flagellar biosynthesis protein FlhB [unclassified Sedimentibacter]|uniref:flagellar biosynthesis protein FlhB n=1 Tax=unclassified Sedimentibacter TaxID=2649220 RepID=UPI0027E1478D|nr:flagellar biosynthesis protein FlhB [Sedimentibacter sp. MB35-C1]WMJ78614.1 flagellar biosynthesis protein FlhB [Sedimentibacter sp. MB35-C1]
MAGENKTEKASPKKRRDERKKGNVFQSKDIVTVGVIAVSFVILNFWAPHIYIYTAGAFQKYIHLMEITYDINDTLIKHMFKDMAFTIFASAGLLMVSVMAASIIFTGAQTKFLITKENIKFKFSKLNPLTGIKKMFSIRSLVEITKNIIKIAILGYVIYSSIIDKLLQVPKLASVDLAIGIEFIFSSIMAIVKSVIIAFVAISAFDFLYSWWEYEKNIRMTKQEVKEEYKQLEGDPLIKGKIKERQRAAAMTRMMQQVPKADVIIRNPTHFAVAIKYDIDKDNAPIVLAKGMDNIAMKIIEKAENLNISIVENVPLARALYASAELNHEIPLEYYEPVAEVLAWVYRLREKEKH